MASQTWKNKNKKKDYMANKTVTEFDSHFKFIQIMNQEWEGNGGIQSSIIGLGNDGRVYKYFGTQEAWMPLKMDVIVPSVEEEIEKQEDF